MKDKQTKYLQIQVADWISKMKEMKEISTQTHHNWTENERQRQKM